MTIRIPLGLIHFGALSLLVAAASVVGALLPFGGLLGGAMALAYYLGRWAHQRELLAKAARR